MSKLLPSQLSESELLALLESGEESDTVETEIFDYEGDLVPFLQFYNITPGNTPTSKKLLYKLYRTYSKAPASEPEFNHLVGQFIEGNSRHYYHINQDNFAISALIYKAEKTRDKTKSLTYQRHFDWFLKTREVTNGMSYVEGFILYYIYKDFCRDRKVNPKLGYTNFHKFLKLHFKFKRIRENRSLWFRVDYKTAQLLSETEQGIIRDARSKKKRRSKEESTGTESPTE